MSIYEKLLKAYKVACPIVTLSTADPAASTASVAKALPDCPVVLWDCARGFSAPKQKNYKAAQAQVAKLAEDETDLTEALIVATEKLDPKSVLVISNAHRFLSEVSVVQALWNLRDVFKSPKRMVILMGTSIRVPVELENDVVELDEPLPTEAELKDVIGKIVEAAGLEPNDEQATAAAVAATGVSAFAAEQFAALNLSKKDGLSSVGVWDDKCAKIDETPGLSVVTGGSFSDVAGVENAKSFLKQIMTGKKKPSAIVYIDEIEKAMGASGSDSSGVSQDQLGVLLQYMQDKSASGCIFVGPPGAAKSAMAKTAGGEGSIPTIQLDLGGMKGSLVGESETRIRDALKVVDAVSGGNTLWLATCNSLASLPPELKRRFKFGTWFFDLPSRDERQAIWDLYVAKTGLESSPSDDLLSEEWTGAEIESCCDIADRTGMSIDEASAFIVPVCRSAADKVEALRSGADGKFISASYQGVYSRATTSEPAGGRDFD